MFLNLSHTKLDVYQVTRMLVVNCYRVSRQFPIEERFAMMQQIRRASLSVHLNLAEGSSRKSKAERTRFFEVSRSSVVEIDACLEMAVELNYVRFDDLKELGDSIVKTFKMLSGMINSGK